MTLQDLQTKLTQARKSGEKLALSMLQVILGDVATLKARTNKEPTEAQIETLIRSIRDGNVETLKLIADKGREADGLRLIEENTFLSSLLPVTLTVGEIKAALAEVQEPIVAAGSDQQAMGVAMKFLKPKGLKVLGNDVKLAVEALRHA